MNKRLELNNRIKELQVFNINGIEGKILYSTYEGVTGSIWIKNNTNSVPFAHENNGSISYHSASLKFAPITSEWIKENLEGRILQLVNLLHNLDKISFDSILEEHIA